MKRVLVVDDDSATRRILKEMLRDRYAVSHARNGSEALELLRVRLPDAVVLDMMMPVMDGQTFLKICRSQPQLANVPVLVLSGEPTASATSQLLGAQACIAKPFDVDILLAAVERLLS